MIFFFVNDPSSSWSSFLCPTEWINNPSEWMKLKWLKVLKLWDAAHIHTHRLIKSDENVWSFFWQANGNAKTHSIPFHSLASNTIYRQMLPKKKSCHWWNSLINGYNNNYRLHSIIIFLCQYLRTRKIFTARFAWHNGAK